MFTLVCLTLSLDHVGHLLFDCDNYFILSLLTEFI